jgi:hypothetical protein
MLRRKAGKGALAGPRFVVPILGCIVEMVLDPFGFWERQRECVPVSVWMVTSLHQSEQVLSPAAVRWGLRI